MKLGAICRIVLIVRDFDASLRFYRDTMGLEAVQEFPGWAVFRTGDAQLCLRGPWPDMPFDPDDCGRSPDEILFRVEDLDAARNALLEKGVVVQEPHAPGPGIRVAELADPDGRRIALEERKGP